MLTIGAISSIPGYKWCATPASLDKADCYRFMFLGNNFNYASRTLSIFTKVCVQQAVFTPIFNTYFFGMQALLTGESPSGIIERIRAAVPVSMLRSLQLWPAVTAISFAYVKPEYRFMFSGIFAVGWQAYLSFLNRKEEKLERIGNHPGRALAQFEGKKK
jgi:protein Mpv17